MKLSLVLALFGLVALHLADAGTIRDCRACLPWERRLWSEACAEGLMKYPNKFPCTVCHTGSEKSTIVRCANQEKIKAFQIYHDGQVYCMEQGRWDKMGRLRNGQQWPRHNKFLEKIGECPPYFTKKQLIKYSGFFKKLGKKPKKG